MGNPYDHSPVRWLASGGGVEARGVVPPFGVSVSVLFDESRACSPGAAAKLVVNCGLQSLSVFNVKTCDMDMATEGHAQKDMQLGHQINWLARVTLEVAHRCGGRQPSVD